MTSHIKVIFSIGSGVITDCRSILEKQIMSVVRSAILSKVKLRKFVGI